MFPVKDRQKLLPKGVLVLLFEALNLLFPTQIPSSTRLWLGNELFESKGVDTTPGLEEISLPPKFILLESLDRGDRQ